MRVLGVICARGGSKGIINKNLRLLDNKPLIWHSIVSVNHAQLLTRTIVSTDSLPILAVAKSYGADVPFLRPMELAQDTSRIDDAVLHAFTYCEKAEDRQYDAVVLLQNSSPLRQGRDIDSCIKLLNDGDAVMSVSPMEHYQIYTLDNNQLKPLFNIPGAYRRQDVSIYTPNGAVYAIKRELFLDTKRIMNDKSLAYIMPLERALDIHTEQDLIKAEAIIKSQRGAFNVKNITNQSSNPRICQAE